MQICLLILLGGVAAGFSDNLMDRTYGEALLNTLSPSLREKLIEIHNEEEHSPTKSEKQLVKAVKSRLTPEELVELEAAYRKLILPMLQSTLEREYGKSVPLNDVPLEFDSEDYEESSEEVIDEDFLDSSDKAEHTYRRANARDVKEEL